MYSDVWSNGTNYTTKVRVYTETKQTITANIKIAYKKVKCNLTFYNGIWITLNNEI